MKDRRHFSYSNRSILLIIFLSSLFLANTADAASPKRVKWAGLYEEELISMKEVREKQVRGEKFLLIDARNWKSFNEAHIQGAVLSLTPDYYRQEEQFRQGIVRELPETGPVLAKQMKKYLKNTEIVTYCNEHCEASAVLLLKLKRLGYNNVRAMESGFQAWQSKGYPVSTE